MGKVLRNHYETALKFSKNIIKSSRHVVCMHLKFVYLADSNFEDFYNKTVRVRNWW